MRLKTLIVSASRILLAGFLSLAMPMQSWADVINIAQVTYQDTTGTALSGQSNTVTTTVTAPSVNPTLAIGSASGAAGTSVDVVVSFNTGNASVSGLQFDVTVPPALSTGTVTPGTILSNASKSVNTAFSNGKWSFIVFGLNQNAIATGQLLTMRMSIAAGTAAGTLALPISNVVYSDGNGQSVPSGTNAAGSVVVTGSPTPLAPVITSTGTASGVTGSSFSYQITASNSPNSFGATGLPTGLSVNTTNGLISGTPSAAGISNVTLSATNTGGTGTKTLVLTITSPTPAAPSITSAGTATGQVNVAFTYQITATNSPNSYGATGLPAGLAVNATNGLISGTPTTASTSNVTVSATNTGGTGTKVVALTISPASSSSNPFMAVGSGTGQAGSTVDVPITFTAGSTGVAGIQFDLTLPTALSTSTVTPGVVLTNSNKSVSTAFSGGKWSFIVFGLNQTSIQSGTLLSVRMNIAPGTPAGTLPLNISGTIYADANGSSVTPGTSTNGSVTVTAGAPTPTLTGIEPPSVTEGDPDTIIQLTGTDFPSDSKVVWADGTVLSSVRFSATSLSVLVPSSKLISVGTYAMKVQSATAGQSNAVTLAVVPLPVVDLGGSQFVLSVNDTFSLQRGVGAFFTWTFAEVGTASTSGGLRSKSRAGAIAPTTTSSPQLSFATLNLTAGTYFLTVTATNAAGKSSAPAQATVVLVGSDLSAIQVFPNPWRKDRHAGNPVTFNNLPVDVHVQIFSVSGHLVKDLGKVTGQVTWDLTNDSGSQVSSGLYIYLLTSDAGGKARGKLAVIR